MLWRLLKKTLGSWRDPWTRPNWAPTRYTDHRPKNSDAAPGQILDVKFLRRFPSTLDEIGSKTGAIESVLKLSFQPYKERPNPTPFATWASVLVLIAPGLRIRLEVESVLASTLAEAPLLVSLGGGQGGGHQRDSFGCSPPPWIMLQLGPGSQG